MIQDTANTWLGHIYTTKRCQSITIKGCKSPLRYVVPQGSVLKQYTVPIGAICRKHGVSYQLYADDTQICITFHIKNDADRKAAFSKIEGCVAEIRAWMVMDRLKVIYLKTRLLQLTFTRSARVSARKATARSKHGRKRNCLDPTP